MESAAGPIGATEHCRTQLVAVSHRAAIFTDGETGAAELSRRLASVDVGTAEYFRALALLMLLATHLFSSLYHVDGNL